MKKCLFILAYILRAYLTSFSQTSSTKYKTIETIRQPFYIFFYVSGLGSNLGKLEPTFRLNDKKFIYTKEQNSSLGEVNKKVKRISSGIFRQSSIDSIIDLVRHLKDSTVFKFNPCILGGGIYFLTIANGTDTTKFELMNTFDYTALKIVRIINNYLPTKKQIRTSEKLIKDEEDCITNIQKRP